MCLIESILGYFENTKILKYFDRKYKGIFFTEIKHTSFKMHIENKCIYSIYIMLLFI